MRTAIVSGYFNPLHVGHLRMMRAARDLGDQLVVIVNNDRQQLLKKGKIIMPQHERLELVSALAIVSSAFIAVDDDAYVAQSLRMVRFDRREDDLIFCNGGDRSRPEDVAEYEICQELSIDMRFGVGGQNKADSSSRINEALGV